MQMQVYNQLLTPWHALTPSIQITHSYTSNCLRQNHTADSLEKAPSSLFLPCSTRLGLDGQACNQSGNGFLFNASKAGTRSAELSHVRPRFLQSPVDTSMIKHTWYVHFIPVLTETDKQDQSSKQTNGGFSKYGTPKSASLQTMYSN